MAQWAAAVGVASLVYRSLAGDAGGRDVHAPGASSLALLAFAVTNEIAMALVLRLVNRSADAAGAARTWRPEYVPHALIWSVNAALGVLFAVAVATSPATAFLLLAPLAFLRWSHQAYLSLRADRSRLDGLARAVARLAVPIDPPTRCPRSSTTSAQSFTSTTVELVRVRPAGRCCAPATTPSPTTRPIETARLLVVRRGGAARRSRPATDAPVAAALVAAGHRDALAAPLVRDGRADRRARSPTTTPATRASRRARRP